MKSRRVVISMEVDSSEPIKYIKEVLELLPASFVSFDAVHQIQVNVIKPKGSKKSK
jgi:hypothetical protein